MRASSAPSDYRPDVDGLRAIAVLSVMIFHAHDAALPGGFVGVDIFFVISGYLISKHIVTEVLGNRFSFLEFYRRRIRRIVPMMMVVVAATLLGSLLLMTPEDSQAVAKSAVWSIASMANIHFWRDLDTGYFANSSAEVPLLHLWSLGVEEQFYFLWPLLLVLGVRRLRPGLLLASAAVMVGVSFALASRIFDSDASFAYYMLPTRLGELMLGALAGITSIISGWRLSRRASWAAGWLGVVLIAWSLWAIDRHDPFPGWFAFPPTFGAALLILAGEQRPHLVPGLTSRPMLFVGKISYSAYLWHWPLFALFRYGYGDPGVVASVAILVLTMLLAWLSFRFVERPTRGSNARFRTILSRQFMAPAAALFSISLLVIYAPRFGVPLGSSEYLAQLKQERESTRPAYSFDWICQRQRVSSSDLADPRCVVGAAGSAAPTALLWGDSNAAHYVPMVREIAARAGIRFRNIAVGACPPLLSEFKPYVDSRRLGDCFASAEAIRSEIGRYPVILIAASWSAYLAVSPTFLDDLAAEVRQFAERGQSVILIGKAPILERYDRRCREKALRVPFKRCSDTSQPLAEEAIQVNRRLRALADATRNVRYFDGNHYLCPNGICGEKTRRGLPRYFDGSHLTVSGSTELGLSVLAAEGIPSAFSALQMSQ